MRINNKFELLEAIGSIDEKYVKKANKLIKERPIAEQSGVRVEHVSRRFSWRSFAAAAACASVLILGGTIAAGVFNRQDSIAKQLNKFKTDFNSSAEVVFAHDRLEFTELELPAEYKGYTLDSDNCYPIDAGRILAGLVSDGRKIGAGIYNISDGSFDLLHIKIDTDFNGNNNAYPVYADSDYAVIVDTFDAGSAAEDTERRNKDALYVYDLRTLMCVAYFYTDEGGRILDNIVKIGDQLYFTVEQHSRWVNGGNEYIAYDLNITTNKSWKYDNKGTVYQSFKGDLVYITPAKRNFSSMLGLELSEILTIENDPDSVIVFGNPYVFGYKHSAFDQPFSLDRETLTNLSTGETILSSDSALKQWSFNKSYMSLDIQMRSAYQAGSDEIVKVIYNMEGNELLVFEEREEAITPKWFGNGIGLWIDDASSGDTVRAVMVYGKGLSLPESPVKPEKPDDVIFLDDTHALASFVPIVSADDVLEFTRTGEYPDDEIYYGGYPTDSFQEYYVPPTINGYAAKLRDGYFKLDGRTVRAVTLCRTDDKEYEFQYFGSAVEVGYYDPETRSYTTLFECDDSMKDAYFRLAFDNYLIFGGVQNYAFIAVEISSIGSPGGPEIIKVGEGLDSASRLVDGGRVIYFNTGRYIGGGYVEGNMYSFDTETGEIVDLGEGLAPYCFLDELFYREGDGLDAVIRSMSGKYSFPYYDVDGYSGNALFGRKSVMIGYTKYDVIYNMLTDENILGFKESVETKYGNKLYLSFYHTKDMSRLVVITGSDIFGNSVECLYDSESNRVITYDTDKYEFYMLYEGDFIFVDGEDRDVRYEISFQHPKPVY